jgi:multidrug resistance efflux pump
MRAKVLLPIAAGIIIAGAILWAYPRWMRPSPLILSGTIEARDVQVGSLVGGRIMAVHVDEGASVVAGQKLVTLEPDLLDIQIQEQRAQIDQARARLALQLAGPRAEEKARVRVDWQNAEAERQRLEALLKKGVVAQEEYDRADATARMKLEVLQENERGSRREDIDAARATLAQQESHLAYLLRQRKETVVTAPADGVIQSFSLRPGDLVAANQAVLNLLEMSQLWVRVYVPETQMGLVRMGQEASLAVDTFPGRAFPGKIVEIREKGEYTPRNIQTLDQRTDLVFGVKVAITPTPELKPGMSALVTLKP